MKRRSFRETARRIPGAVLAVLAAGATTLLVSRDTDDASLTQAQAARQIEVQRCVSGQLEGVPADIPPQGRAQFCERGFIPPVPDRRFHYENLPEILTGTSRFAIILGWLLGASLIGAEWHAGTMASLLTWEPRRVRVLIAKLIAAAMLVFALTVGLQLLLGAALLPAAYSAGPPRPSTRIGCGPLAVLTCGSRRYRSSATMGLSIATIGRNTAAALGSPLAI